VVGSSWKDPHFGLRKRHVIMINKCCMCKKTEESVDHLLLHCDVSFALWYSIFSFGLSWVMPQRVIDLLTCWWSSGRSRSAMVWKMASTCLFWCLWRERNNRSFEDMKKTPEELLSSFYHTWYLRTTAYVFPLSFSFLDFDQFTKVRLKLLMILAYYL